MASVFAAALFVMAVVSFAVLMIVMMAGFIRIVLQRSVQIGRDDIVRSAVYAGQKPSPRGRSYSMVSSLRSQEPLRWAITTPLYNIGEHPYQISDLYAFHLRDVEYFKWSATGVAGCGFVLDG